MDVYSFGMPLKLYYNNTHLQMGKNPLPLQNIVGFIYCLVCSLQPLELLLLNYCGVQLR